jgi:uncharacterized protein YcsI (UPF0317 family)
MARALSDRATLPADSVVARRLIRSGAHTGHTSGMAPEFVQGNLCILPAEYAADFAAYCQRTPTPCPLLGMGATGDPRLPSLGEDLDIRTDVPRYRVFRDGEAVDEPTDIMSYWRGDNVAMYKTDIDTVSAGSFGGKMVVSMRPLYPSEAIRAVQITSRFPSVHGAPIHIGLPEQIGITDLESPFAGDPPRMAEDEIAVFWGCGVTPQVAVEQARPPLCITHKPGSMIVTDLKNRDLAAF